MHPSQMTRIALLTASCLCLLSDGSPVSFAIAQTVIPMSNHSESAYEQGLRLRYQGRYGEAIARFTTLISENPQSTVTYIERGIAYLESEQTEAAV